MTAGIEPLKSVLIAGNTLDNFQCNILYFVMFNMAEYKRCSYLPWEVISLFSENPE